MNSKTLQDGKIDFSGLAPVVHNVLLHQYAESGGRVEAGMGSYSSDRNERLATFKSNAITFGANSKDEIDEFVNEAEASYGKAKNLLD
jgi:hypothetical protein